MAKFKKGDKAVVVKPYLYFHVGAEVIINENNSTAPWVLLCSDSSLLTDYGLGVLALNQDFFINEDYIELIEHATEKVYDFVNPDHYKGYKKEVYEMMIDIWGKEAFITHCEMCSLKYRMRLGKKPDQSIERDLEKAKWYEDKAKELRAS